MEEKEKMKVKGKAGKEKGHYNNMNFCQKYSKLVMNFTLKLVSKYSEMVMIFSLKLISFFCFHDKNTLNHVAKITTRH